METRLLLQDILQINGIDPKDVLLVRHVRERPDFKKCREMGLIREYTQVQGNNKPLLKKCKYWMVFISTTKTNCEFYKMYSFKGFSPISKHNIPEGFPYPEWYQQDVTLYELEETDLFSDLKNKLIISWGTSTQSWYQSATNNKRIMAIKDPEPKKFIGYDKIAWDFDDMEMIVNDETGEYQKYQTALAAVKGVYLIQDTADGKLYVGSAYGDDGILGRWRQYANFPYHGGNKKMIALLSRHKNEYRKFRFCVLQIMSMAASKDEVIAVEQQYKRKFGTIDFGLNDN